MPASNDVHAIAAVLFERFEVPKGNIKIRLPTTSAAYVGSSERLAKICLRACSAMLVCILAASGVDAA
jgi:hypothetical protein